MDQKRATTKSRFEPNGPRSKILLVVTCLVVLAVTLSAGLWPFSFHPRNRVSWDAQGGGLQFADPGTAMSAGEFQGHPTEQGRSVELWIEPDLDWESGTILAFYVPKTKPALQLRQSGDDVVYTTSREAARSSGKPRNVFVDHTFHRKEPVLITLSSIANTLEIYVNGILKKTAGGMQIRADDFRGTLILGNAPYGNLSWRGKFRGLAFYDHALGAEEIKEHLAIWRRAPAEMVRQNPATLYLFAEREGQRVPNAGKTGPDILIPAHYTIPEPGFLVPFWKEYAPNAAYAKDLAVNVLGLVPLGFCFAALFAWQSGTPRAWWWVVALGFVVSLTIELFQAFMPTRFSGTTDLITNTAGTAAGAWCFLNSRTHQWLERLGWFDPGTPETEDPGAR
jgi:hypothetical protein